MAKKKKEKNIYTSTQVGVILEDIKSDFRVFGEALAEVKEDVSGLKEDMVIVKDELGLIRNEFKS